MHFSLAIAALASGIAGVQAICPGFNYGIGSYEDLGGGLSKWKVYDDSCNVVDSLTTTGNPCTSGTFGCSPPPIHFNSYKSSFGNHLQYACRTDPNSGSCGGDRIDVCCRNDGR